MFEGGLGLAVDAAAQRHRLSFRRAFTSDLCHVGILSAGWRSTYENDKYHLFLNISHLHLHLILISPSRPSVPPFQHPPLPYSHRTPAQHTNKSTTNEAIPPNSSSPHHPSQKTLLFSAAAAVTSLADKKPHPEDYFSEWCTTRSTSSSLPHRGGLDENNLTRALHEATDRGHITPHHIILLVLVTNNHASRKEFFPALGVGNVVVVDRTVALTLSMMGRKTRKVWR